MNKSVVIATTVVLLLAAIILVAKNHNDKRNTNDQLHMEIGQLKQRIALLESKLHSQQALPALSTQRHHYSAFDDPYEHFNNFRRQMNGLMQQAFNDSDFNRLTESMYDAQMDVQEKNGKYFIALDIPGMQKDDIKVNVEQGNLIISGQRDSSIEHKDDDQYFYRQERSFGKFMRTIPLPKDAKADTVDAQYKDGVLTIVIEKDKQYKDDSQGKQVPVK